MGEKREHLCTDVNLLLLAGGTRKGKAISFIQFSFMMIKEDDDEANLYITRRLGTLGALNYCWRPFGPSELAILYSDFVPSACVIYAMVTATKFSFLYFSVFAF